MPTLCVRSDLLEGAKVGLRECIARACGSESGQVAVADAMASSMMLVAGFASALTLTTLRDDPRYVAYNHTRWDLCARGSYPGLRPRRHYRRLCRLQSSPRLLNMI